METTYAQRVQLLYALCLSETNPNISTDLQSYDVNDATNYLACYLTFKAIQQAERSPVDERIENFDMLSVYQAFALLVHAYLNMPLANTDASRVNDNDLEKTSVIIAKSIFAELSAEELADIVESGIRKFNLIGNADAEHWENYREDLDKSVIAFIIAGTDESSPFDMDDLIPVFGAMLSMLCEAFANS
ncbi:MAG TPA: hypothetical protein VGJ90_07150 [Methylophilaceae bacterium]